MRTLSGKRISGGFFTFGRRSWSGRLLAAGLGIVLGCMPLSGAMGMKKEKADICIYGATPAGITAACTAAQEGKSVILIEPGGRIGGMTAGGLGWTDLYHPKEVLRGMARSFYRRVAAHYGKEGLMLTFEPKVALSIFQSFLKESHADRLIYHYRIVGVRKRGSAIRDIVLENALSPQSERLRISARVFMDCSYEGDLMARAGVSYTVGREPNSLYGETINGVQMLDKHQFPDSIDPYVVKGDPTSGLLWGILPEPMGRRGEGDKHVQSYNLRLTLTNDPDNMIPVTLRKPDNYDPKRYELLIRLKEKLPWKGIRDCMTFSPMPNHKCDMNNNGAFSTDMIGRSWDYPEASYARRDSIFREHLDYTLGLLYFLWTDERIPEKIRAEFATWGWPKDEYPESNHITPQLYIRESRRMIGRLVMTEDYCLKKTIASDTIGMADYTMDSHNCGRYVVGGMVKNEGDVQRHIRDPYPVSYRAVTPRREEASNLIVPVCLSASHVAYGSIRMEPVYMLLGETCGLAACEAIDHCKGCVQDVDSHKVMRRMDKRDARE